VHLVDSGTMSFGISCCVWEAAEALAAGAGIDDAAGVARAVAPSVGNAFVVGALDLGRAGGRVVADGAASAASEAGRIPVLSMAGAELRTLGTAADVASAAALMAEHVRTGGNDLRVAIGIADVGAAAFWEALEDELRTDPQVTELVRYRVGPSVGVHTGPGTAGAFFHPVLRRDQTRRPDVT